tara:strand:+ start:60 stop:398 length:339 start_codon:yes stop_codon:yes gene_type:complete
MFPFVNDAYEHHTIEVPESVTTVVLPFVYFGCRIMLTDRFHQHSSGYTKAQEHAGHDDDRGNKIAECPIAIGGDSSEEEDVPDGTDQQQARAACDSEESATRDTADNNETVC